MSLDDIKDKSCSSDLLPSPFFPVASGVTPPYPPQLRLTARESKVTGITTVMAQGGLPFYRCSLTNHPPVNNHDTDLVIGSVLAHSEDRSTFESCFKNQFVIPGD